MFSGKSITNDHLIQVRKLTKSLVKHRFSLHNLCIVGISQWNSELSVFKAKNVGFTRYFDF